MTNDKLPLMDVGSDRFESQMRFLARAKHAAEQADLSGEYFTTEEVLDHLRKATQPPAP
jgi:hypothetical protein